MKKTSKIILSILSLGLIGFLALSFSVSNPTNTADAPRTGLLGGGDGTIGKLELFKTSNGYIETRLTAGYDFLLKGVSRYLNFGTTSGTGGYGIRDNAGTMQLKNSGGSWSSIPSTGFGDVVGPASSTDNALARFDTTTGKLIQNSVGILDDTGNLSGLLSSTISKTSLGTTATDGLILENTTAATAGATVQISPRNRWRGSAWDTSGLASQTFDFTTDLLPISQATSIDGTWRLRSSFNGAAYTDRFAVKTEGNDTKLQVGGVNFFGKAGNQNDFYSGSTSLRFDKNDGSAIYATMLNSNGTWTLSPGTITGSDTTPAMLITQTLNTTGKPSVQRIDITRTAAGSPYLGFEIRENTGSGFNSKFGIGLNTGGTETTLQLNGQTVFAQGSGSSQFYASSSGMRFYDSSGGAAYLSMTNTGFFTIGDGAVISYTAAAPYRFNIIGHGSKVSQLVFSAHTVPTPYYETRSSRGSATAPTATQSGDILGGLLMAGYGTSQWNNQGAAITAIANQTFTNANGGSYLKFETTADGSVTRQDVMFLGANGLIQIAGQSSSYPAIKRNGATAEFWLADGSAITSTQSLYDRFGSGTPEGAVTAPVGAVYHRTDGGAATSFYVKESGSGNTGWVAK